MINVVFEADGNDISRILSTYKVVKEVEYESITTMDKVEWYYDYTIRTSVVASFVPMNEKDLSSLYRILSKKFVTLKYTDQNTGTVDTKQFVVFSNMESFFLLKNAYDENYYSGYEVEFRAVVADA